MIQMILTMQLPTMHSLPNDATPTRTSAGASAAFHIWRPSWVLAPWRASLLASTAKSIQHLCWDVGVDNPMNFWSPSKDFYWPCFALFLGTFHTGTTN